MTDINLDAFLAAHAETVGDAPVITLHGEKFELPPELLVEHIRVLMQVGDIDFLKALLGDEQYERFDIDSLPIAALEHLVEGITKAYGMESPGKPSASSRSSRNGTSRSRRTSSVSTG